MSTSWSSPDPPRVVTGTAFGRTYEHLEPTSPALREDVLAGLVTLLATLLAAAPVGLAWAALAPRPEGVLAGGRYLQAESQADAYIADDGYLFAAVLVAGVVTGLMAWRWGRAHGPAVVSALAAGGLVAAYVASRVGEAVGRDALVAATRAGAPRVELTLEVGALVVLAGWPAAALLAYLAATLLRGRESVEADGAARELG